MEILKIVLKAALQAKASTVSLKNGSLPLDENNKPVGTSTLSSDNLKDLTAKFFPKQASGIHKSKINIKSIGNIFIFGDLDKVELQLFFPPNEEANFKSFLKSIRKKTSQNSKPETEDAQSGAVSGPEASSEASSEEADSTSPPPPDAAETLDDTPFVVEDTLPVDFFQVNAKNVFNDSNDSNDRDDKPAEALPDQVAPQTPAPIQPAAARQFPDAAVASQLALAAAGLTSVANLPVELVYEAEMPGESTTSNGGNPIDKLLKLLIDKGGSDLHLTANVPVCMRIDGDIIRINDKPISFDYMRELLEPIIPTRNREEFSKINDTDFAYEIRNVGRFRVNLFRDRNGIGTVLRVIPSKILTATELDLPPAILKFGKLSKGLVVVTGPTGSGKSTTLAAIVDWINKNRSEHVLTIEDPIEFVHQQHQCLINHREVGRHTTSFTKALRAALREDPDIVLVGEMRDLETVAIGIETAETGHLVFGTLHTNTAVSTVDRIIDQFPEGQQAQIRMMLSESLKGVVAQTLLKKKGGGRIAAHEILVVNDAVGAMIREGKSHMIENHMQTQKKDGNLMLNDCLLNLVERGLVDADHAILKAIDKESLMSMMTDKQIPFEKNIKIAS